MNFHFRSELLSDDWEMARGFLVSEFDYLFAALVSSGVVTSGSGGSGALHTVGTPVIPGHLLSFYDASGTAAADSGIAAGTVLVVGSPPTAHHVSHETGGSDAITSLSGAVITSGTVIDARLSSNVALKNIDNVFVGQTIRGNFSLFYLKDTGSAVDATLWRWRGNNDGTLRVEAINDAITIIQATPLVLGRAGGVVVGLNLTVGGVVTGNGFGVNNFASNGNGEQSLRVGNSNAGASAYSSFWMGNDFSAGAFQIATYSTGYSASSGPAGPNRTHIYQGGAGLSINAAGVTGSIGLWTNGALRWYLDPSGNFYQGASITPGNMFIYFYGAFGACQMGNTGTSSSNVFQFYNANGSVGTIVTLGSGTTYNTTSDKRLKRDRGIARDTTVLERTEIHDFDWISDDTPGRGVFSQDAYQVLPRANTPGTDECFDTGLLKQPWMTDYAQYVPDLIVGWQQHAAELVALRQQLAALREELLG
jgi:hypothetical protein